MPASFAQWVAAVFDQPASGPEWFWASDFHERWESLGLTDTLTVRYLTQLFREPGCLAAYSLDQVAQAIWFLIGEASPAQPAHALFNRELSFADRAACLRAIADFFRLFVAPAAPGPARDDEDPFHIACYMWWDVFPTWGGPGGEPELQRVCLDVMRDVLAVPSELCQLSALHGLNHWHLHHAPEVERIVDAFLARAPDATPRIRDYAAIARSGCAQ